MTSIRPPISAWVLCVLLATGPSGAQAWGKLGHRVTAAIAERCLSPAAATPVAHLLAGEGLAEASTWADFMRAADDPFWRNAGRYHYVTVPNGEIYDPRKVSAGGDALTALARFQRTLRDDHASLDEQRRALRFAVHIIADLHQPLHVGNGKDRGGIDFEVFFFDKRTHLHRLWDSQMLEHEGLSYTEMSEWLARALPISTTTVWARDDPLQWVLESARLRERIYPTAGAQLGWKYLYQHREALRLRLLQGGVRTAAWLHVTFAYTTDGAITDCAAVGVNFPSPKP